MSGPREKDDRRGFLEAPRWMDGEMSLLAAPGFAIFGVACAVGLLVLVMLVAVGKISTWWLGGAVVLALIGLLCAALYRGTIGRTSITLAPKDAPADRLFPVALVARGGWLRQYLEPAVGACVVVEEDGLRLCFRRPMNQFMLAVFVFNFARFGKYVGFSVPDAVGLTGSTVCFILYVWSATRRHDLRFPWARVLSVAAGEGRFHVRLDDEEWPDGILFAAADKYRVRLIELFRERTLFHDEDETAPGAS